METKVEFKPGMLVTVDNNGVISSVKLISYEKGWWRAEVHTEDRIVLRSYRSKQLVAIVTAEVSAKSTMSSTLGRYAKQYVDTVSFSGRPSKCSGDLVSQAMETKPVDFILERTESLLGLNPGTLVTKYQFLNNGQKRMNAGNRIRAAYCNGSITDEEILKAFGSKV